MAQTVNLILNTPYVMAGTAAGSGITYTFTIPALLPTQISGAGIYRVSLQTTVAPSSGLRITVKQNGTTVYTAPTLSPTQTALQFQTDILCAVADVITVNLTSSTSVDEMLNTIQTTVQIMNGL
jgi:hypothetical protein